MKKVIFVGLTFMLLLVLVACSDNKVNEAPTITETEHTDEHPAEPVEEAKATIEPEVEAEAVEPEVTAKPVEAEPEKAEPEKIELEKADPKEQPAAVEPKPVLAAPKTHKVEIVNFAFSPASLDISVGDIVEFTNLDAVKHSAVEDNSVFDTGLLGKNESKQMT